MTRKVVRLLALAVVLNGALALGYGLAMLNHPPTHLAPETANATQITFFAVGRQGYDPDVSGEIAKSMEKLAKAQPPHFLIFGGDNFYPHGVSSVDDSQWRTNFEDVYRGPHLQGTPAYAVLGNHDLLGDAQAQLDYATQHAGTGRWRMDGRWYTRDFGRTSSDPLNGRPLLRVVFLDMIPMLEDPENAATQTAFLREAMNAPGDPVWRIVVGHNPLQSLTQQPTALTRIMHDLRAVSIELGVDLAVSSNDWFQQLLDVPGEPLYLSTSGGGRNMEQIAPRREPSVFVAPQRGFARVTADALSLRVELFDDEGHLSHTVTRSTQNGDQVALRRVTGKVSAQP